MKISKATRLTRGTVLRTVAVASSGFLLSASFPPMENWEAAWVGLVPLLLLCLWTRPADSLRWGLAAGAVFWLTSLTWLLRLVATGGPLPMVVVAWLALSLYCALYLAAFAATLSWTAERLRISYTRDAALSAVSLRRVALVLASAALWVGWEFLRGTLFTGFSWNALGVSQVSNRPVLQVAELGGVYAVSAILVMINMALALTLAELLPVAGRPRRRVRPELMLALGLCVLSWISGARRVDTVRYDFAEADVLRVAAVQPNIAQERKWAEETNAVAEIYQALETHSDAARYSRPELIVWPETALPGAVPLDVESDVFVRELASRGVPILTGAVEARRSPDAQSLHFWNSSCLYTINGLVGGTYRKVHLVPFGEYIPFDRVIPALGRLAPLGFSCRPGTSHSPLAVGKARRRVGVLICFEDSIPRLSRLAVGAGASLLVNQTNDAWFDGSSGARQHMHQCILRAVENRVGIVRSANTGITCYIDPTGRVSSLAPDEQGRPVSGFAVYGCVVRPDGMARTLYSRFGDWLFAVPCAIFSAFVAAFAVRDSRKTKEDGDTPIG